MKESTTVKKIKCPTCNETIRVREWRIVYNVTCPSCKERHFLFWAMEDQDSVSVAEGGAPEEKQLRSQKQEDSASLRRMISLLDDVCYTGIGIGMLIVYLALRAILGYPQTLRSILSSWLWVDLLLKYLLLTAGLAAIISAVMIRVLCFSNGIKRPDIRLGKAFKVLLIAVPIELVIDFFYLFD